MKASETSALIEVIKEQNKTIESLRKTIEEMSVESKILREQIEYLTKKLFGTKSEKMAALTGQIVLDEILNPEMSQDLGLFNEAETDADVQEEPDLRQKATKRGILGRKHSAICHERKNSIRFRMKTDSAPWMETDCFLPARNISGRKLNTRRHP